MKLQEQVLDIFVGEKCHQLATASPEGIPNVSSIACKYVRDDDAIVLIDNYWKKTMENVLTNPHVAVLIRRDKESYQIKGTGKYVAEGPEYEEARKWMKSQGDKYPAKGALIVTVEEVFNSASGADAGKKIQ